MSPSASSGAGSADLSCEIARRALQRLNLSGALRTVDVAFSELLQRLGAGEDVALAGALAMRAVALGDSGFALERSAALLDALDASATLPDLDAWRDALGRSPLVAPTPAIDGSADVAPSPRPLLVFEHDRVALLRYARYEHDLARRLLARIEDGVFGETLETPVQTSGMEISEKISGTPVVAAAEDAIAPGKAEAGHPQTQALLRRLFAQRSGSAETVAAPAQSLDRQALAAFLALRRRLLLLTGGPGTGKTTTVARMLALAVAEADARRQPPPRIALAAPTGRAAVRLAEAVATQLAHDVAEGRLAPALAAMVPTQAGTLHRLLGVRPDSVRFRYGAGRSLPFDVVVVDEASMIDLPLMDKLVAAVAPQARLVLIGDPDQLPAVEAGDVLGALCAASGDALMLSAADAAAATQALGVPVSVAERTVGVPESVPTVGVPESLPTVGVPESVPESDPAERTVGVPDSVPLPESDPSPPHLPLAGARVHLLRGWRQDGAGALPAFAAAVRAGETETALALLAATGEDTALRHRHGEPQRLAAWLRECAMPVFAAVRDADSPEQALAHARRLRLLTAVRRGPFGADTWNAWCAAELGAQGRWFHGALIAIAANSAQHGLYNGDLGVIRREADGSLMAWFALPEPGGGTRWGRWRPAQLPAHALAFAGTVHKAQGSEFDRVALILPERPSRALGRELLYTAATRARHGLWLWAAPERLREAIARRARRDSGLLARLRAGG